MRLICSPNWGKENILPKANKTPTNNLPHLCSFVFVVSFFKLSCKLKPYHTTSIHLIITILGNSLFLFSSTTRCIPDALKRQSPLYSPCFCPWKAELICTPIPAQLAGWYWALTQNWLLHIQTLHIYTYPGLFLHWFSLQYPHVSVCKAFAQVSLPLSLAKTFYWILLSHIFSLHYWSELLLCFPCVFSLLKNNVIIFFFLLYLRSSIHHILCRKTFWNKAVLITALKYFTLSQFGAARL